MIKYQNISMFYIFCFFLALLITIVHPVVAGSVSPGGLDGDNMELGASPANTVSITAPSSITGWLLRSGDNANTRVGVFQISADGDWKINASDLDTTSTNGKMTEWDGFNYVSNPKQLATPLKVSAESGEIIDAGYEVVLPFGGMIANGGSTSGVKDVDITFKQLVSSNAEVLANDRMYRIVVTITISPYI